ncbi:hypothetical protein LINPERHAP1_LOCUS5945 [Linum perenne]
METISVTRRSTEETTSLRSTTLWTPSSKTPNSSSTR